MTNGVASPACTEVWLAVVAGAATAAEHAIMPISTSEATVPVFFMILPRHFRCTTIRDCLILHNRDCRSIKTGDTSDSRYRPVLSLNYHDKTRDGSTAVLLRFWRKTIPTQPEERAGKWEHLLPFEWLRISDRSELP